MAIYQLDTCVPLLAPSAWVAESAHVVGRVELDEDVSIWFGAVMRGDNELLRIGRGSNVQDGSVVHSDKGFPVSVGDGVTVGHQATLHGCTVGHGSLIGIHAVVLNGAEIGPNCLVAAGALVTPGQVFAAGSLIVGSPARIIRSLTLAELEGLQQTAQRYVLNARRFREGLKRLG